MPRAEVGSQKWLANKMKSKGLQKLKWYCQMCEKQCRDENGFKCHITSEGHQRQMQVFRQHAGRFMDTFSRTFENQFMRLMRTRYAKTKILANTVYQEMISDKTHVHMNSTVWVTLSEFVLYLARSGKCKVEDTPRGWVIEYIDREKLRRMEEEEGKRKRELSTEQRQMLIIQQQIEDAKQRGGFKEPEYTPLIRSQGETIRIETKKTNINGQQASAVDKPNSTGGFKALLKSAKPLKPTKDTTDSKSSSKRKSALELLAEATKKQRESQSHKYQAATSEPKETQDPQQDDCWLTSGILVKVILQDHPLYSVKCKVLEMISKNVALLEDPSTEATFEVPDKYLETTIPPIHSSVKVLRGKFKGSIAKIAENDADNLKVSVLLDGHNVERLTYDDVSAVA